MRGGSALIEAARAKVSEAKKQNEREEISINFGSRSRLFASANKTLKAKKNLGRSSQSGRLKLRIDDGNEASFTLKRKGEDYPQRVAAITQSQVALSSRFIAETFSPR